MGPRVYKGFMSLRLFEKGQESVLTSGVQSVVPHSGLNCLRSEQFLLISNSTGSSDVSGN